MNKVLHTLLFASGWILAVVMLGSTMSKIQTTIGDLGKN